MQQCNKLSYIRNVLKKKKEKNGTQDSSNKKLIGTLPTFFLCLEKYIKVNTNIRL